MRKPYWRDPTASLYLGDAREVLADLSAGSVDCIVTSPPRWTPNNPPTDHVSLANAPTPALYIAGLRRVCAEAHRVLADDGSFWLVLSDHYANRESFAPGRHARHVLDPSMTGLPASSLIGLPWQVASALHDDGWLIRDAIVWDQSSGERTTGRIPFTYELIFRLAKHTGRQRHRGSGTEECRPGNLRHRGRRHSGTRGSGTYGNAITRCRNGSDGNYGAATPGNAGAAAHSNEPGDVWSLPGRSFWDSVPTELPLRCISAGCRPGGTVLDPFAGIATTGIAARELGRSFIGIEADPALCELAKTRLSQTAQDTSEEPE